MLKEKGHLIALCDTMMGLLKTYLDRGIGIAPYENSNVKCPWESVKVLN